MGLGNLANSNSNQSVLVKNGILDLLADCLQKQRTKDERLIRAVYDTLFKLSFSDSIVQNHLEPNAKIISNIERDSKTGPTDHRKRARKVLNNIRASRKRARERDEEEARQTRTHFCYSYSTNPKLHNLIGHLRERGHYVSLN